MKMNNENENLIQTPRRRTRPLMSGVKGFVLRNMPVYRTIETEINYDDMW